MFFIDLFVFIANIWGLKNTEKVSGQLPPRKIGSVVRVKVRIRVGGQFSSGEIVLKPTKMLVSK